MALQPDRLAALIDHLASVIEAAPLEGALPPGLAGLAKVAKLAGVDLAELARNTVVTSLRRLPPAALSDPARADDVTAWAVHAVAWLDGQVDEEPPRLELW